MFPVANVQSPVAPVVQDALPDAPPLQVPVTVAPLTVASEPLCTTIDTVARQEFLLTFPLALSRSPTWTVPPVVGVAVAGGEAVGVSVAVGAAVAVAVGVSVGVAVAVGVSVGVAVAVGVSVGVAVAVGVSVGVAVAVGVSVGVGVAVGVPVGVAQAAWVCVKVSMT